MLASTPAALGSIVDVHLLLAHVPLDDLFVLDHVLAHPYLLLNHGALLDDLLLAHRHKELLLADLGLRGFPTLDWHPFDAHFLAPLGHPDALAVGPHPFAHLHRAGLALAGAYPQLLLGPLHLEFVPVDRVAAAPPVRATRTRVAAPLGDFSMPVVKPSPVGVVLAVGAPVRGTPPAVQPVVFAHPLLVLGRYLLVLVKGGAFLDSALGLRDLDYASSLVDPDSLHRDQGRPGPQESRLYAYVLGAVVLVDEEVVYLTDLLAVAVVDLVFGVPLLKLGKFVAALLCQNAHLLGSVSGSSHYPPPCVHVGGGLTRPVPTSNKFHAGFSMSHRKLWFSEREHLRAPRFGADR